GYRGCTCRPWRQRDPAHAEDAALPARRDPAGRDRARGADRGVGARRDARNHAARRPRARGVPGRDRRRRAARRDAREPAARHVRATGRQLARPIATGWRFLVRTLLGDMGTLSLRAHALAYGMLNVLLVVVWAATSRGYFWPEWTMIGLGLPLAVHASLVFGRRALTRHALIAASAAVVFTLVWAVTSRGYFWPLWQIGRAHV